MSTKNSLILLQENSGKVPLPPGIPAGLKQSIFAAIDKVVEPFEDMKTMLQASGHYDTVHILTDEQCSREKLLDCLIAETKKGQTIDLIVLGHGSSNSLVLKKKPNLAGGSGKNLRSLLTDAKAKGVNKLGLRMVYMCNCYGSTLNDDWLAIGAKASVGSIKNDYMPEPMTTFFMNNWLSGQTAKAAAKNAYEATIPFFAAIYLPTTKPRYKTQTMYYPCPSLTNPLKQCKKTVKVPNGFDVIPNSMITETELVVGGDGDCTFQVTIPS